MTAGNVAAQTDVQPQIQIFADGGDAGGEVHIGGGAMGDKHTVFPHHLHFLLRRPDAVRHNGLHIGADVVVFAEEVVIVIGIPVEGVIGTEEFYKFNLPLAFRQMGLDGDAVGHLDLAQFLHQRIGAAGDEAGGEDGFGAGEFVFHPVDPAKGGIGGHIRAFLGECLAGFPVHIHLAHKAYKTALLHQPHQKLGGIAVAGGEDAAAGGGALLQGIHE